MKNTLETRLGIFVALAIVALFIILETLGTISLKPHKKVYADFKNVQELKVGDPVKMAGVQIGRVDRITITNLDAGSAVRVALRLDKSASVHTDSKVTVKFAGLMGQNYVAVDFGTPGSPMVEEGQLLAGTEQPDLNALMSKLDNVASGVQSLTTNLAGDQMGNLFAVMTDVLRENRTNLYASLNDVRMTASNLTTISSNIVQGNGLVGRLINDPALVESATNLLHNFEGIQADIKLAIGQATNMLAEVNAGRGTLGKLLTDESLFTETHGAMTNLHQILFKANHGEGTFGKLLNDDSLLRNVKLSLQKLDKATESLEDTGPLSVLGTAVNSLF
jgi:phospholipid/cholesterol/gamma-HCH transport system substrate-binding protein